MPDSFDRKLLCRLRARLLTLGGDSLSGGDWLPCRPCEDGERSLGGALEEDDKDCAALAWSTTLAPDCERALSLVEDAWKKLLCRLRERVLDDDAAGIASDGDLLLRFVLQVKTEGDVSLCADLGLTSSSTL